MSQPPPTAYLRTKPSISKLNPAAAPFNPSTTSLTSPSSGMTMPVQPNSSNFSSNASVDQYLRARKAASHKQNKRIDLTPQGPASNGNTNRQIKHYRNEGWRRLNEIWPEAPTKAFLEKWTADQEAAETEKRQEEYISRWQAARTEAAEKKRREIEELKLTVGNERAKLGANGWRGRDIDWRLWRMEAKILWYEKTDEAREFLNKGDEQEARRLRRQEAVEKKVIEKDDEVRRIRKEQLRKKLAGEREGRILTQAEAVRDMEEVERYVEAWNEEFRREDRDARKGERRWVYAEDAWFEKKGIFAEGDKTATQIRIDN